MDTTNPPLEEFERWFYGGAPPAGDEVPTTELRVDESIECRCTRTAHALMGRLRASMSVPCPVA